MCVYKYGCLSILLIRCSEIASVAILAPELVDGLALCTSSAGAIEAVRNITSRLGPMLACARSQ